MNGRKAVLVGLGLALATAGCTRFGPQPVDQPTPLTPVPTAPVQMTQLPPPVPAEPPPVTEATPAPQPEPAALPAPEQQLAVQRSDMIGGWTIESGGQRCQLFMVLTGWTGGYRASTRGCQSDVLKSVSAWDLNGNAITLKDSGSAAVATLYSTAPSSFQGRLASGQGITVSR
ncbi:AprI/Inh family metalloprotease inhibitor [Pseudoxanthobacter sp.]|uniref:AprI/Inh family metalloprotease inhibitor n=1 Tax=Pseudoxanthobacter sp. TaxID=1925742 RepID=UPI002FE3942A